MSKKLTNTMLILSLIFTIWLGIALGIKRTTLSPLFILIMATLGWVLEFYPTWIKPTRGLRQNFRVISWFLDFFVSVITLIAMLGLNLAEYWIIIIFISASVLIDLFIEGSEVITIAKQGANQAKSAAKNWARSVTTQLLDETQN